MLLSGIALLVYATWDECKSIYVTRNSRIIHLFMRISAVLAIGISILLITLPQPIEKEEKPVKVILEKSEDKDPAHKSESYRLLRNLPIEYPK
jgi:hypothetical protein